MKLGPKVVLLLKDPEGFGEAISDAFHPNPTGSVSEESFELSLERYGIRNCKASGKVRHFLDQQGQFEVSVLLMEYYESPILACAFNEVLAQIAGLKSSSIPTIVAPFFVASSKLKWDSKSATKVDSKGSLYGIQIGAETDISKAIIARTQKAPPTLQIHYEPLACLLQLVRVLNLPTFILIGQRDQRISDKEELEILYEIGELLANTCQVNFSRGKITWKPTKKSKDEQEPWRALYG
ncbi:PREDICTED: uncharacterized protein LOC101294866 [Fragaria vesca subsp. vesca]|uniref:uncharacterized protein LOC101294866 n=1 Tax=Fragaria vesca subsp. vesca TaxID=101020 RepID=UPI0002C31ACA|nr:PREDICTED: uncharacterized protein LOC101294866 [Fragaria vesca subsp. vesca]